jgi:hypothetical protein
MAALGAAATGQPAPVLPPHWLEACEEAWEKSLEECDGGHGSQSQRAIAALLRRGGWRPRLQQRTPDGRCTVDIVVRASA